MKELIVLGEIKEALTCLPQMGIEKLHCLQEIPDAFLPEHITQVCHGSLDELFKDTVNVPVYLAGKDGSKLKRLQRTILERRHVIADRPLISDATERDSLEQVLADAKARKLVVTCNAPRRFHTFYTDTLQEIVEGKLAGAKNLGKIKHIKLYYHDRAPEAKGRPESLLLERLFDDIDTLSMLFDVESLTLKKHYESSRVYSLSGVLRKPSNDTIQVTLAADTFGSEAEEQAWVEVQFEHGLAILRPGLSDKHLADLIVVDKHQKKMSHLQILTKPHDDSPLMAFAQQVTGAEPYVEDYQLMMQSLLPIELHQPWQNIEATSTLDANLAKIYKDHSVSDQLQVCVDNVKEGEAYDWLKTAFVIYDSQLKLQEKKVGAEFKKQDSLLEAEARFDASAFDKRFAFKLETTRKSIQIAEAMMAASQEAVGVLPYYRDDKGELHLGMIRSALNYKDDALGALYEMPLGQPKLRLTHPNKHTFTASWAEICRVPKAIRALPIWVPRQTADAPLMSLEAYKESEETGSIEERTVSEEVLRVMQQYDWAVDFVEKPIVAAGNTTFETHGYNVFDDPFCDKTIEKVKLNLPVLNGGVVEMRPHTLYLVPVQKAKLESDGTKLVDSDIACGVWVSQKKMNINFERWLLHAADIHDPAMRFKLLSSLHRYIGIVLTLNGQEALKQAWLDRLRDHVSVILAGNFEQGMQNDALLACFEALKFVQVASDEKNEITLQGKRPEKGLTDQCLDALPDSTAVDENRRHAFFCQDRTGETAEVTARSNQLEHRVP